MWLTMHPVSESDTLPFGKVVTNMLTAGLLHNEKLIRTLLGNALGVTYKMHQMPDQIDKLPVTLEVFSGMFRNGPCIDRVLEAIIWEKEENIGRDKNKAEFKMII